MNEDKWDVTFQNLYTTVQYYHMFITIDKLDKFNNVLLFSE